jgi:hypothetical protein
MSIEREDDVADQKTCCCCRTVWCNGGDEQTRFLSLGPLIGRQANWLPSDTQIAASEAAMLKE